MSINIEMIKKNIGMFDSTFWGEFKKECFHFTVLCTRCLSSKSDKVKAVSTKTEKRLKGRWQSPKGALPIAQGGIG